MSGTVTRGIISGVRDNIIPGCQLLQTDVAVNPGSSGGPVIDSGGRAVGLTLGKLVDAEAINFAVPAYYLRGMLSEIGRGLSLAELNAELPSDELPNAGRLRASEAAAVGILLAGYGNSQVFHETVMAEMEGLLASNHVALAGTAHITIGQALARIEPGKVNGVIYITSRFGMLAATLRKCSTTALQGDWCSKNP